MTLHKNIILLQNLNARPTVKIQNDLGFQVSSGLKANHSVVVISRGTNIVDVMLSITCTRRKKNTPFHMSTAPTATESHAFTGLLAGFRLQAFSRVARALSGAWY